MWYFTWIVGIIMACSLTVLDAIWFEFREKREKLKKSKPTDNERMP